jgi:hypothetical protein
VLSNRCNWGEVHHEVRICNVSIIIHSAPNQLQSYTTVGEFVDVIVVAQGRDWHPDTLGGLHPDLGLDFRATFFGLL